MPVPGPLNGTPTSERDRRLAESLRRLSGEYHVVREIGRGGMAVVYLARDRSTGQEVALKLIRAPALEDDEAAARFAREARIVARVQHPRIVPILAVRPLGELGIAIVMPYVRGRTLKQLLREHGAASFAFTDRVLRDIGGALGAAHEAGIVHRDVKPENIFLDEAKGHAYLADFGIARAVDGDTHLTMDGSTIGTPTYMSPEQIDGSEVDGRSDLYALGIVAWEMLNGRRPWDGESLYTVLYKQKHEALPPLDELRPDIPPRLLDTIEGLLEKHRDARWQNADELMQALSGETPPQRRRSPAAAPSPTETVPFRRPIRQEKVLASSGVMASTAGAAEVSDEYDETSDVATLFNAPRRRAARWATIAGALALAGVAAIAIGGGDAMPLLGHSPESSSSPDMPAQVSSNIGAPVAGPADGVAGDESLEASSAGAVDTVVMWRDAPAAAFDNDPAPPPPRVEREPAREPVREPVREPLRAEQPPPRIDPPAAAAVELPRSQPAAPIATAPVAPTASTARFSIITGGLHTCVLSPEGRVWCWGANDAGQLGSGGTSRSTAPVEVRGDVRFTTLESGLSHTCALGRGGAAWCWGDNDNGQLGDATTAARSAPSRVAGSRSFRALGAGTSHTCALDQSGAAWCWGANTRGQIGDGAGQRRTVPTAVEGGRTYTRLAVGWNHSCAIDREGRAWCWGENSGGQLGDGTSQERRTPVPVGGETRFTELAAGNAHTCGITTGGEVHCWGSNQYGQSGNAESDRTTPAQVRVTGRAASISAGSTHTCVVTREGAAFCWGRNAFGQLGDGTTSDRRTPVRVAGGHTFASIRAFGGHSCGTTSGGENFCWGYNLDGQLGDGTRTNRTRPVYVEKPSG